MLYVTTRDDKDAYTAHRTLHSDFAPDGGQFIPFKLPAFTEEDIKRFADGNFGQNVAEILNLFFSVKLNGPEIELSIGRNPVKLVPLSQKITVAEIWHNPISKFQYTVQILYKKITADQGEKPTLWFETVVRIAFLFGIFGEMHSGNAVSSLDVAISAADASVVNAVWMAKKMGLPLDMMIIACDEGSAVWDVLRRGVCTNGATESESKIVEQVIYHGFGPDEVKKYLLSRSVGTVYSAEEERLSEVRNYTFVAAVSRSRLDTVASSVMRTDSYRINDDTAAAFGGLQDYRASTRENRMTLILVEDKQ